VIDARKIVESIAEIVINVSVFFHTNNAELMSKIKRDSLLLEQKIEESRETERAEFAENARQNLDRLVAAVENKASARIVFSDTAVKEADYLFAGLIDFNVHVHDYVVTENKILKQHIQSEAEQYTRFARDSATKHEERLIQGVCQPTSSAIYLDMLNGISGIFYNLSRLAE